MNLYTDVIRLFPMCVKFLYESYIRENETGSHHHELSYEGTSTRLKKNSQIIEPYIIHVYIFV